MEINLLIVDDKTENIIALEALLDRADIKILTTTSPNHALKICWDTDISIALVDVQMPEMSGFELATILKSNTKTKDILIIFVTAISKENKYAVKGLNAGAVDYLFKPLDPEITLAKVDSFIQLVKTQKELRSKNQQLEQYQKELITARDAAEQGKKAKAAFLANMSHEIRTPINGIIGLTNLLLKTDLNESQKQMLEMLEMSSGSLLGVINDILDLSKIESGKFSINPVETDIISLCGQVVGLLDVKAKEKGIALVLDIDPKMPKCIMADSLRLNQIFMNLLSNAVKFTNVGQVIFRTKVLQEKVNMAELEFAVIDCGIGIAEHDLPYIFDSFEQVGNNDATLYGGTGLGLSIVKKLAELKKGRLNVSSKISEGSTFTFTKWYEVVKEKEELLNSKTLAPFEGLNALVAEDSPINRFLIQKILKDWHVNTIMVANGEEALNLLKESDFDIVLMDTYMPVLNGLDTIKMIRNGAVPNKQNIPIISFSAGVMDTDRETALMAGADEIVGKPFKLDELHEKIKSLITKRLEVF